MNLNANPLRLSKFELSFYTFQERRLNFESGNWELGTGNFCNGTLDCSKCFNPCKPIIELFSESIILSMKVVIALV